MVGAIPREQIEARLRDSLTASLARLARDYVDVYILHGYIIPDGWQATTRPRALPHIAVEYSTYRDIVIPVFESLMASGKISAFGITAASTQVTNLAAVENSPAPALVQRIANVLDSLGNMAITEETAKSREVIQVSKAQGVGVMGIRAVAAGALATAIDRVVKSDSAEAKDFARAEQFRHLAVWIRRLRNSPTATRCLCREWIQWCLASKTDTNCSRVCRQKLSLVSPTMK